MTITNGYSTLAQFKQRFGITTTDTNRDADIEYIIQAVSRLIDKRCYRHFYATSAASARLFTAEDRRRVYVDDYTVITTLKTDDDGDGTIETTWAATDFEELPASSPNGWPYTWIEITPEGAYRFPKGLRNGVEINAVWGWTAVPDEVREACLLQSNRLWQRRSAPFGVQGANEFGVPVTITKLDPDVETLLTPFVRLV